MLNVAMRFNSARDTQFLSAGVGAEATAASVSSQTEMGDTPHLAPDRSQLHYRVGDLRIDLGRQRVTRGGDMIALPKLSYDLLITLVREAPNLVSNDALMEQVWPRLVVSPETVSQRVKLLRDALGDDPRKPRYVEGLRGRGYRLIPAVERDPVSTTGTELPTVGETTPSMPTHLQAPSQVPESPPVRPQRLRRHWLIGTSVAAASLIVALIGLREVKKVEPSRQKTSVSVVAVQPRAVAVLPFDNLSAEAGNEYIALGIAESVLNRLGSNRELIVIARSSSFALGKSALDAREAGRILGARYLVEGSVQRAGKKLRVNAQLIDTTSNNQLWSLSFDRTIDDVFAVQDEIAQRVAAKLDVDLRGPSAEYAKYGADAYLALLKGRALLESQKIDSVEDSIGQFSLALELAPSFAAAMAELAQAKIMRAVLRDELGKRGSTIWPEVKSLVDRGIEIDPAVGELYLVRAQYNNDDAGVEADLRKGVGLAPNYVPGLTALGNYLFEHERYDEALTLADRAIVVDPLTPRSYYTKGEVLRLGFGAQEEAAALYLRALEVAPDFYPAHIRLASVRFSEGRLAEAIKYGEKSIALEPRVGWTRERLVWFYVDMGDLGAARDVARGFGSGSANAPTEEALICYRAGNLERAELMARRVLKDPDANTGGISFMLATEAVVERAIAMHTPGAARQFIFAIPDRKKDRDTLAVVRDNFPTVLQLAALEHAAGDANVARELAQRILKFMDSGGRVCCVRGDDERVRASALALLGRNDEAISHLERMIDTGNRIIWWETLQGDPSFATLRAAPRFQAIVAETQTWLAGQQRLLQQMRQRGEVPSRSAVAIPGGC